MASKKPGTDKFKSQLDMLLICHFSASLASIAHKQCHCKVIEAIVVTSLFRITVHQTRKWKRTTTTEKQTKNKLPLTDTHSKTLWPTC